MKNGIKQNDIMKNGIKQSDIQQNDKNDIQRNDI